MRAHYMDSAKKCFYARNLLYLIHNFLATAKCWQRNVYCWSISTIILPPYTKRKKGFEIFSIREQAHRWKVKEPFLDDVTLFRIRSFHRCARGCRWRERSSPWCRRRRRRRSTTDTKPGNAVNLIFKKIAELSIFRNSRNDFNSSASILTLRWAQLCLSVCLHVCNT